MIAWFLFTRQKFTIMSRDYIEQKEIGDYRITIYPDYDAECPVTNWDMGACYIFEHLDHGRYNLCSDGDWAEWVSNIREESVESILQRIAAEVVTQEDIIKYYKAGKVENVRFRYDRHERQWKLEYKPTWRCADADWQPELDVEPCELKAHDYRMELLEPMDEDDYVALIQECAKDFVLETWESSGYCQGDHIRGIAYTSKERFDKYCGFNPQKYKTWQEQARDLIDAEVKEIDMWAWGDVKGFVLEKKVPFTKVFDDKDREDEEDYEWEEVDSCWGYFMETEELIKEVMSEYDIKEVA